MLILVWGVSTGLDLPGESEGYISKNYNVANVLTEAFGQYDSYTTIQLAQYVASIANGGKRVAPHIVGGIYDAGSNGSLGTLASTVDTRVLIPYLSILSSWVLFNKALMML